MKLKMHFPPKQTRPRHRQPTALHRSRRNAVIELSGDRERHLETLFMAICSGDTDEMTQILRSRATSTYTDASSDLINCACATGNASTVQILLQHSVPFRSVGGKGDAPLHTAVRRGSLEIPRLLLDHGADVNVETKSERRTPLHIASASRKLDVLKYLLENEAEVDKVDIYGSTALHLAAEIGFSNGVSALIESHADPDVFNRDGWTAMHLAAANGHLSVVQQLISAHAMVDCQNRFGKTPLHWACVRGHLQVVRVLLEHNASVDVRDKNEKTAFDHAATREIRNLIDVTAASVSNLSVIPRISSSMHYAIGESTLRLTRASAFVDALERVRWSSSYMSSDSGIDCPPTSVSSQDDDGVFEESGSRWSLQDGESELRQRRRQRKTPIWSKPEDWRPVSAPAGSIVTEGSDLLFQLPRQKRKSGGADGIQLTSAAAAPGGRSISAFSGSLSSNDLVDGNFWWLNGDAPQRSHSEPQHLEKARQLGRFLCPIMEDDKTSVATTSLQLGGGCDETPRNNGRERKRPSSSVGLKVTRQRPRSREGRRPVPLLDSSEDDSMKESRKSSDSDSENTNTDSRTSSSEYSCCSHELTKDLEKILKRVSLAAAVKDAETFSGMHQHGGGSGVQTSHALIGALNSGLRQLLSQIEVARDEELDGDTLFSEA